MTIVKEKAIYSFPFPQNDPKMVEKVLNNI